MKLKAVLALTATLTLGAASAQVAGPTPASPVPMLQDVPAGHFAKDAVDLLTDTGIIIGFPDGTFRGNEFLTRYQAALIIARLLERLAEEPEVAAEVYANPELLLALQNAVQELAADLAALGVRVADIEESVITEDDLARALANVVTADDLAALQDRLGATVTAEELAPILAAIEARLDATVTADDLARIEDRLDNLGVAGGDEEAIADLQAQLDELVVVTEDLVVGFDTLRADLDDTAANVAALNDLTVLLNQDILSLQDRVATLETGKADIEDVVALTAAVGNLDDRLDLIEARPIITLTGGLESRFGNIGLISGTTPFDVDRLTNNTFAAGAGNGNVTSVDATLNPANVTNNFNFGIRVDNLATASEQIIINKALIGFGIRLLPFSAEAPGTGAFANRAPQVFTVSSAALTGTIATNPFEVVFQNDFSKFFFNPYLFNNNNDEATVRRGVVATFAARTVPLQPSITLVTGNGGSLPLPASYFGVRAAINPFGLGTLGTSFATNTIRDALGLDFALTVGPFLLNGAYVTSALRPVGFFDNAADIAFYTNAAATFGALNVVANVRAIEETFDSVAAMSADALSERPWESGQFGFGVGASTAFGAFKAASYFDTRTAFPAGGASDTDFGVNAGVQLFRGLGLVAYFNNTAVAGTPVTNAVTGVGPNFSTYRLDAKYMTIAAPFLGTSSLGAAITHNGAAPNALVSGLDLTASFTRLYLAETNDFQVFGSFATDLGGVAFKPFARFHSVGAGNFDVDPDPAVFEPAVAYNTFKVGTTLATQPLGVVFGPSFAGGVSFRSTSFQEAVAPSTSTELFANASVILNNIFGENTSWAIGASRYSATNVTDILVGSANTAFDPAVDIVYGDPTRNVFVAGAGAASGDLNGLFTTLNLYGIKAQYGIYNLNGVIADVPVNSVAQGFKIGFAGRF